MCLFWVEIGKCVAVTHWPSRITADVNLTVGATGLGPELDSKYKWSIIITICKLPKILTPCGLVSRKRPPRLDIFGGRLWDRLDCIVDRLMRYCLSAVIMNLPEASASQSISPFSRPSGLDLFIKRNCFELNYLHNTSIKIFRITFSCGLFPSPFWACFFSLAGYYRREVQYHWLATTFHEICWWTNVFVAIYIHNVSLIDSNVRIN